MIGLIGKPDVAIGTGGDAYADAEEGELIFRDYSIRCDRSNFACRTFTEPDVAVWPRRNVCRIAQARSREVADLAARSDASDFAAVGKREPKVAVFTHRNRERLAAFTDRGTFDRRCLGGSAADQDAERGYAARNFQTKWTPREDDGCNSGTDEVEKGYHKGATFGRIWE